MMIWAEYAVKSYSQAWKDVADSLTTPDAFNEISLPACKPERMLSAGEGIKNLLDDNNSDYRSAVRSVLVIYDVCNERYEEVISCRDGIKSYFEESLDSRKRLCEAYRKITVTTALLWSHADNIVSKKFSRSRVPHGWDDEIKLVEERLREVERALEVDVPRNT
ncbi:MAG: hypothetical protein GYB54_02725 [Gammaproteobacteria bacterium]|nr:hypothetical protein [Gammaproteobacteria bacterium]